MLTRAQSGRQAQCIAVRLQVRLASSIFRRRFKYFAGAAASTFGIRLTMAAPAAAQKNCRLFNIVNASSLFVYFTLHYRTSHEGPRLFCRGRNKQGHRLQVYSNRRAVIGSMRLARWAGIMPAAAAIVHRSRTIVMAVRGSVP